MIPNDTLTGHWTTPLVAFFYKEGTTVGKGVTGHGFDLDGIMSSQGTSLEYGSEDNFVQLKCYTDIPVLAMAGCPSDGCGSLTSEGQKAARDLAFAKMPSTGEYYCQVEDATIRRRWAERVIQHMGFTQVQTGQFVMNRLTDFKAFSPFLYHGHGLSISLDLPGKAQSTVASPVGSKRQIYSSASGQARPAGEKSRSDQGKSVRAVQGRYHMTTLANSSRLVQPSFDFGYIGFYCCCRRHSSGLDQDGWESRRRGPGCRQLSAQIGRRFFGRKGETYPVLFVWEHLVLGGTGHRPRLSASWRVIKLVCVGTVNRVSLVYCGLLVVSCIRF